MPATDALDNTRVGQFMDWLRQYRGVACHSYGELHAWSVDHTEAFWRAIWDYFDVIHQDPPEAVARGDSISDMTWFPGATLNFAENALRHRGPETAVVALSQTRTRIELSWDDLRDQVGRARSGLERLGVRPGDRVAGYLPNIPEALFAYLATVSLGAIWTSCPPEFGVRSVIDRFKQVDPKVLLTVDGYRYGEREIGRLQEAGELSHELPHLEATVLVPYLDESAGLPHAIRWDDLVQRKDDELQFESVEFNHPLVIVYSSGTTGLPKPIVHGHGNLLIEHLKYLGLAYDLGERDRAFWFTTTGWVMWNILTSALLHGTGIVLFDGDPGHPSLNTLWDVVDEEEVSLFGVSAGFFLSCRRAGLRPAASHTFATLRTLSATGSPMPAAGYEWIYESVKSDVAVVSGSGGTDVATGFVGGSPLVPIWAGEMSCKALGCDVVAMDEHNDPVVGREGELVVRKPMPSMPVTFWNDADGTRRREAYFDAIPGVWRHGDWITFTERGSSVISGRSDATLNRGGVRLGTSEFYSVVEEFPEVIDSLVVHVDVPGRKAGLLLLFIVLEEEFILDEALRGRIGIALRTARSPRHVPDRIFRVATVPRTLSGKRLEVPVKRILMGAAISDVVSEGVLADPASLSEYVGLRHEVG